MKRGTFSSFAMVGAAALPALLGLVLLAAQAPPAAQAPAGAPAALDDSAPVAEGPPPAIYARFVCSFANDDAKAALVQGADGGYSVVAGERSFWLFGDTLFLPESGKQIEQNAIAWSSSQDAAGCPRLAYHARDGIAVPFLPKDGSLTAWPSGAIATADGAIDFYTVYVYGSGPYAYWIGEVGLARLDPKTMQVSILERRLWTAYSGFPSQVVSAQPIDRGPEGLLRVVLQALDGSRYLARVPQHGMRAAVAYEVWTGDAWSTDPVTAAPLWPVRAAATPIEKLSLFENSAHIAWNARLQKYVALTNAGYDKVGARMADRLEGPWSDPVPWLDCKAISPVTVPVCYSALQHPQYASAGGRTQYITFTRMASYDVVAYEVTPGTAVHEYLDGSGSVAYATTPPGDGWADQGIAFYAADAPLPGFGRVYRWSRGDEIAYDASAPGGGFSRGEIAFYAPLAPPPAGVVAPMRPVFAWSDGTTHLLSQNEVGLEAYGFTRGEIAFYAP